MTESVVSMIVELPSELGEHAPPHAIDAALKAFRAEEDS